MRLDDWQDAVLQAAMGERSDGTWAADVVGLSVPRQNGKSLLLLARALAGALLFGETKIVISAHAQDTARETFAKLLEMRDDSPALDERIDKVMSALNREFVKFKNGAVIQFKARTISGSRGFSCDCLLLDEAQILGMPAWVSIRSTMSARPNPQAWLLGTPPTPEDNGEVFTSVRASAMSGKARRTAWLEWAAEQADDPALDKTRAKANPAWQVRINHEVVQGEYETYPTDRFALDRLGIWAADQSVGVITRAEWEQLLADAPQGIAGGIGLDRTPDQEWCSVGIYAAGFVDVVEHRRGVEWVVESCARLQARHGAPIVVDPRGPASSLIPDLVDARLTVIEPKTQDCVRACSSFLDDVRNSTLHHGGHSALTAAVEAARKRSIGDGWLWDRKAGGAPIAPLVAVTLARWVAHNNDSGGGWMVSLP